MIKTQCSNWAEPWAQLRDHAKPVVPRDVDELREVRAMVPPSKGHVKRLTRVRPVVVIVRPKPTPTPCVGRLNHNVVRVIRESVVKAAGQGKAKPLAAPLPRKVLPDIPPSASGKSDKTFIADNTKLERDHMVALSKMVYANFEPDEARILRVFGSVDAWERAKCL